MKEEKSISEVLREAMKNNSSFASQEVQAALLALAGRVEELEAALK